MPRPRLLRALGACLCGLIPGRLLPAAPDWSILVDLHPFTSVEAAVANPEAIAWDGPDLRPANASTLAYAATELRDHLRQLTPETVALGSWSESLPPRAIVLSTWDEAQRHPQLAALLAAAALDTPPRTTGSFALVPAGDRLLIIGADRSGALYGAYAWLDQLGVRWYGPAPHETHLPPPQPLRLPTAPRVSAPDFATRGFWVREDWGNEAFYRWMARNRLNFWSIAEPRRGFLHQLGMHLTFGGHHTWQQYLDPGAPYPFDHPAFAGDEDLPPDPYPAAAATPVDRDHDGRLTFFEARPEWYGLNEDGVRTPFEGMYGMNVCSANPAPLDYLYRRIVAELATGEWRDVDSLNFWSIDNGDWCQCPACRALGEPTDRLLLMVHGLDQAVDAAIARGEIRRPIKIIFPIYQKTLPPPSRPLPPDFDTATNIGTFFPILRCYVHRIDDPDCTEYNTEHWHAFQGWTRGEDRHYRGELFVGEYLNVSVNKSLPAIYPRIIATDVPTYYRGGARHFHYMHTDTRLLGVKRINNFLLARVLWDVDADLAAAQDAYFADLYGPVAADLRAIYDELEFALSNIRQLRYWHHLPDRISEGTFPLFDRQHFQLEKTTSARDDGVDLAESVAAFRRLRARLDTVLARDLPPVIRTRLAIDDQTIRYGENTVHFYDALARAVRAEHAGDLALARAEFARSLPFARALRDEAEVVKTATNHHVHADNGLAATRTEEAWLTLGKRLHPDFEW